MVVYIILHGPGASVGAAELATIAATIKSSVMQMAPLERSNFMLMMAFLNLTRLLSPTCASVTSVQCAASGYVVAPHLMIPRCSRSLPGKRHRIRIAWQRPAQIPRCGANISLLGSGISVLELFPSSMGLAIS